MGEIKTIDKLPRVFLEYIAERFGYKAWDCQGTLQGVTDEVSDKTLAQFISDSLWT